jgi:hypothetical protein
MSVTICRSSLTFSSCCAATVTVSAAYSLKTLIGFVLAARRTPFHNQHPSVFPTFFQKRCSSVARPFAFSPLPITARYFRIVISAAQLEPIGTNALFTRTCGPEQRTQLYLPVWQVPDRFWPLLANGSEYVVRTAGAPLTELRAIRHAAHKADASSVVYAERPMQDIVANSVSRQRFTMALLSAFSAIALALSAVGIYGVISYLAAQRTHEIGVRVALGASRMRVLRMMLGQGMRITLIGVGMGIAAALVLTRLIGQLIYGIGTTDPLNFLSVAILLFGVSLLACNIHARRAMVVNPIIALRQE